MILKTASIFNNGMVLQHGKPISIWGIGNPSTEVKIKIQGHAVAAFADGEGKWSVMLPALKISENENLSIRSGDEDIEFNNVAVGEVWLAAGQSNMEFYMRYDADLKEAKSKAYNRNIRFFDYPEISYEEQIQEYDYSKFGYWRQCDAENLDYYSAVAYYFAKKIQEDIKVPVGIVGCNWGGTRACCWMNRESIIQVGGDAWLQDYEDGLRKLNKEEYIESFKQDPMNNHSNPFEDPTSEAVMYGTTYEEQLEIIKSFSEEDPPIGILDPWRPCGVYETMLKKIIPFGIRGVLFYQGESDEQKAELYQAMLQGLISNWRNEWKEELPFLIVQLAPFGTWLTLTGERFPEIRRAQEKVSKEVPQVWMASIGDVGMYYDIHPKKKRPVGERLALLAEGHVYGKSIPCDAPEFMKLKWKDNKLFMGFSYVQHWNLAGNEVQSMKIIVDGEECKTEDYQIESINSDLSIVFKQDPQIEVQILFAQTDYYEVNLYNEAGIPLKPFCAIWRKEQ